MEAPGDSRTRRDDVEALLAGHFAASSQLCRAVEREQARQLLASVCGRDAIEVQRVLSQGGDGGVLIAEPKAWESGFFGCAVFQLSIFIAPSAVDARRDTAEALLRAWIARRPAGEQAYLVVRAAAEDVALAHALEAQAFSLLVPMVTLEGSAAGTPTASTPPQVELGPLQLDEVELLGVIARDAFSYGRFWVEPRLSHEVAAEMHATWARNCCTTTLADEVIVARVRGRSAGFIAMRSRRYGHVDVDEINLIAVEASHRGRGLGHLLVEAGRRWSEQRTGMLVVRTELPNTQAVRLYERCGFCVGNGSLYYRRWLEPGRWTSGDLRVAQAK